MTHPALEPELAAAYVRELSADVRAVLVLDGAGERLAGPEALVAPARSLTALLAHGAVRTTAGLVVVAGTGERTLIAVAGPLAVPGPTLLDAAAAVASSTPELMPDPAPELEIAVADVIAAT